jgi:hypothetical protein
MVVIILFLALLGVDVDPVGEAKRAAMFRQVIVTREETTLLMTSSSSQPERRRAISVTSRVATAFGLKTLPDAIATRNRLLKAFKRADMESDPAKQARDMTIIVLAGGTPGVAITITDTINPG